MMNQSATPYIYVFDLGNVLIRWDPRNLYRKIFGEDHKTMEWFLAEVCNSTWNERHDAGLLFADGIAELLPLYPQYEPHIRAYFERWEEMLGEAIEPNVTLLQELQHRGIRTYALSNWSAETFPIAQGRYQFLNTFDGMLLSGHEKLIKPDPAFFSLLFSRFKLAPSRAVFIDDVAKNVRAARKLGMQAIQYHPELNLRAELLRQGLL